MELNAKARELGERLAQSIIPDDLQRTVLERLPTMTEHELDLILSALRNEEGQLRRLEAALKDFAESRKRQWAALAADEETIVAEAVDAAVADRLDAAVKPPPPAP